MMRRRVLILPALLAWGCGKSSEDAVPAGPPSKYVVGSEYSFKARPSEEKARFLVLRVDPHQVGPIVHIALEGVHLKNPKAPTGFTDQVRHLPIVESALDKSGPQLLRSGLPVPDFQAAYEPWKKSFAKRKAGLWTIPLADCLQALEQTLANAR